MWVYNIIQPIVKKWNLIQSKFPKWVIYYCSTHTNGLYKRPDMMWLCLEMVGIYSGPVDIWGVPEMGVPPKGWFIRENPIKVDDEE